MTKTILKDAGILRVMLKDLIFAVFMGKGEGNAFYHLLDQAFAEEEEKEYTQPKNGDIVWKVFVIEGQIKEIRWVDTTFQRLELERQIIHPTKESAQKFLEAYKEWVKNYKI